MSGQIFLVQGTKLVRLDEAPYEDEDSLQALLAEHPDLLAGDQIDSASPRRWLLLRREAGIPDSEGGANRWSVDHLFLDQDGVPTLVEVKRSTDTRIRREVVGQMLDYAANAVRFWPMDAIRARFEAGFEEAAEDKREVIAALLGPDAGDDAEEELWQRVKTNLQAGRLRLVFVADEIPTELRRIVEFLNAQMDPAEVLAVEVKRFSGDDVTTLVPRVVGQTAAAQGRKRPGAGPKRQWDETSFFAELERRSGSAAVQVAQRIRQWCSEALPRDTWGRGANHGSFIPALDLGNESYWIIALWTNGSVELQFQYMMARPPFDQKATRDEWRQRLNQISGVDISLDKITKRPSIQLEVLTETTRLDAFLEALDWAVAKIRSHHEALGKRED
jgi:hypothetical protein